MSFLTPLALIGLALAVPIILLYMLRLRRREVVISSTYLWQQVLQDREANTPWQKLRRNLLLFLQLLILLLLVLALARPFIIVPAVSAGQIAVLLDASTSMNATDSADGTRFAEAQQRALELVDTMSAGDTMTVIRVAGAPEVISPYTDDRAALRTAIQSAQPSQTAGDWNAALTLAAAGAAGSEDFAAVIISDGGINEAQNLPPIPGTLRYIPVGSSSDNMAISALAIDALPGEVPQLFAQITNYSDTDADVIFSLYTDDSLFTSHRYTVPANESLPITSDQLPTNFTTLEAEIRTPTGSAFTDYLSLDDQAWTVNRATGARRILLMTAGNLFLEQALRILPDVQTFRADPAGGLPTGSFDVSIFDGYLPPTLPSGDLLIINPPTSTDFFQVGAETEAAANIRVTDDPRMAYVDFSSVNVRAFKQITADWATPLIVADGGPLLLAGETNGQQVAILTFDLTDSDLPLQIAFPVMMSALLDWFHPPSALENADSFSVGQPITVHLSGDMSGGHVILPDGTTADLQQPGSDESPTRFFAGADTPGLYTLEMTTQDGTIVERDPFAVNSFDADESRITPRSTLTLGQTTIGTEAEEQVGQQEFWPWLALAALIVLLIEWYAYHRRLNAPTLFRPLARGRA